MKEQTVVALIDVKEIANKLGIEPSEVMKYVIHDADELLKTFPDLKNFNVNSPD